MGTVHDTIEAKSKSRGSKPIPKPGLPNVIFLMHEGLSGSIMLTTREGKSATPFFQDKMQNDPNMYVFEHASSVSGNTIDSLPALMTGCLPYTEDAMAWAHAPGRAIGYEFAHGLGYATASFSSRRLDRTITAQGGQWHVTHDPLAGAMDAVFEPGEMNGKGCDATRCDDRKMVWQLEGWLANLENSTRTKRSGRRQRGGKTQSSKAARAQPFYAQLYSFNNHYPWLGDPHNRGPPAPDAQYGGQRYYDSLVTTDEFLKSLFDMLSKTGRLDNTIIIGSGDTGEDPFRSKYVRLSALTPHILQPASYIYYPQHLMPDQSIGARLRRNTKQMVSILDLFPTIYSIAHNGGGNDAAAHLLPEHFHAGCVTGVDLTSIDIPNDRVTISWNAVSASMMKKPPGNLWALNAKDPVTGKAFSLYHRLFFSRFAAAKQGKNNFYQLVYGPCLRDVSSTNLCMISRVNGHYDALARRAISWIKYSQGFFGEGVKSSELVEFFAENVGWEDTGEMLTARSF